MEITTLDEIEKEIARFMKRLNEARDRIKISDIDKYYFSGSKETGAVKRAALDLKNELTKITK